MDWRSQLKKTGPGAAGAASNLSNPPPPAPAAAASFGTPATATFGTSLKSGVKPRVAAPPPAGGKASAEGGTTDSPLAGGVVLRKTGRSIAPTAGGAGTAAPPKEPLRQTPAEQPRPAGPQRATVPFAAGAKAESSWIRKQPSEADEWETDPDHVNRVNFVTGKAQDASPASKLAPSGGGATDWRAGLKKPLKGMQDAAIEAGSPKRGLSPRGGRAAAAPQPGASGAASAANRQVESDPKDMARRLVDACGRDELAALLAENMSPAALARHLADKSRQGSVPGSMPRRFSGQI